MKYFYYGKALRKCLFLCFMTFSMASFAQVKVVKGTVLDSNGESIPGVAVTQKGTTIGTVTDISGNYQLQLQGNSGVLVFSFIGYKTEEIEAESSVLNVTLEDDIQTLNEVVVIGYGTASKKDVLGATSSIKAEAITQTSPINAFEAMQGRLPGVQIATNNGPGASADIKIRGLATMNAGAGPLFVVDGQQLDNIDNLDPNSIASIEVLKDGASAAIYGSRSANGVIMITTKNGRKNEKPTIEANYIGSYSYIYNKIPVANTRQRYDFERLRGGGSTIPPNGDSLSLQNAVSVDVQDAILRPAYRDQISLSIRGGGENSNYYVNTSYLKEEGVIVNSGYERINLNMNLNFDISDRIRFGSRLLGAYELRNGLNEASTFGVLSWRQSNLLLRDYDGSLAPEYGGRQNPLAEALISVRDIISPSANFFNYLEIDLLPSLKFRSTLGIEYGVRLNNQLNPTLVQAPGRAADGFEQSDISSSIQQENYFNYNKTFGTRHNFTGLLGMSTQVWNDRSSRIQAVSFANDLIPTFNNVDEFNTSNTGSSKSSHSLSSVFARVTYDFDKRYLFAATLRRDGSSRFGSDKRWGNFPSVSVGWRASNEDFLEPIFSKIALTDLKFRAGFAVTGNERIGNFDHLATYSPGNFYNGLSGIAPTRLPNPLLGWEETEQINFGADIEFFQGRLRGSVDLYRKTTSELLYDVPVPEEFGFSQIRLNVGSIQNRGVEFDVSGTPISGRDFTWTSGFNIAFNENEVVSLANGEPFFEGAYKIEEGQPLGNFWGFENLGVYAYDESNAYNPEGDRLTPVFVDGSFANSYTLNGQVYDGEVKQMEAENQILGGGDIIWKDLNNDFNIDPQNDRGVLGNGLPKTTGGFFNEFRYKNFSLSFLFNFNFGNDIYRHYDDYRNTGTNSVFTPSPEYIDEAWRDQGDVTNYPSLQANRRQNRLGIDSQFLGDADYVRLQNIRLNYDLPEKWLEGVSFIEQVSMNLSFNNLFTLTNYVGYNPELGSRGNNLQPGYDRLRYPNKTSIIYSLRVQF